MFRYVSFFFAMVRQFSYFFDFYCIFFANFHEICDFFWRASTRAHRPRRCRGSPRSRRASRRGRRGACRPGPARGSPSCPARPTPPAGASPESEHARTPGRLWRGGSESTDEFLVLVLTQCSETRASYHKYQWCTQCASLQTALAGASKFG